MLHRQPANNYVLLYEILAMIVKKKALNTGNSQSGCGGTGSPAKGDVLFLLDQKRLLE